MPPGIKRDKAYMSIKNEEKRYEAPNKEERIYGQQQPKFQEEKIYGQQQQPKYQEEREDPNFPDMTGVAKVEQSEKIINEGGKKVKIIIVKAKNSILK